MWTIARTTFFLIFRFALFAICVSYFVCTPVLDFHRRGPAPPAAG